MATRLFHCATRARRAAFILGLIFGALLALPACNDVKRTRQEKGLPAKSPPPSNEAAPDKPEPNTEVYEKLVENPFQLASREPLSTFSADVDTASYSNVRRFLFDEGKLPPRDAVRVEELVNYFRYAYPGPKDDAPVAMNPELTACPWNAKHKILRIGVQSRLLDPREMPPRNFVFLIDSSGSMAPSNRLPLLKQSLKLLIDQLNERDRVAIVTYAGDAQLVLNATPGDQRGRIEAAINSIHAGGSTNGGGGIELAYDIAARNFIQGGLNRVILGTDGDFNVGVTSPDELVRLIERRRKGGVFLTVLGFGIGNLKDATLEKIAHHGNGHYAYIDSEREAYRLFVQQGAALVVVAKDVKFQVEFNPKHVAAYRLIGYENRLLKHEEFNDDQKDAGDMGSGHTVTALYEIVPVGASLDLPGLERSVSETALRPAPNAGGDEWIKVNLRYKDPLEESSRLMSVQVTGASFRAEPSDDCRFAMAVASFGMLLRDSPYKGSATFADVINTAEPVRGNDPARFEFVRIVKKAMELSKH
jgi:Ca-activated chloride channel family protein